MNTENKSASCLLASENYRLTAAYQLTERSFFRRLRYHYHTFWPNTWLPLTSALKYGLNMKQKPMYQWPEPELLIFTEKESYKTIWCHSNWANLSLSPWCSTATTTVVQYRRGEHEPAGKWWAAQTATKQGEKRGNRWRRSPRSWGRRWRGRRWSE